MPIITTIRGNLRPFGKRFNPLSNSTGGTITTAGGYRIHTFTTVGTSTFTATGSGPVEYLIVAGGGGGGSDNAGGGGGGGVLASGKNGAQTLILSSQTYQIVVGNGSKTESFNNNDAQTNGENSSAFGLTAVGGGRGASGNAGLLNPGSGGSGGGGEGETVNASQQTGAAPSVANQGFAGGNGGALALETPGGGGGGGGAGSAGSNATGTTGGNGGTGYLSSISGTSLRYGSGGGGASQNSAVGGGTGGTSSGGGTGSDIDGINGNGSAQGGDGQDGYGGGGGGSSASSIRGGFGGSGVVIIRYPI